MRSDPAVEDLYRVNRQLRGLSLAGLPRIPFERIFQVAPWLRGLV